jgi:hypothetical protein
MSGADGDVLHAVFILAVQAATSCFWLLVAHAPALATIRSMRREEVMDGSAVQAFSLLVLALLALIVEDDGDGVLGAVDHARLRVHGQVLERVVVHWAFDLFSFRGCHNLLLAPFDEAKNHLLPVWINFHSLTDDKQEVPHFSRWGREHQLFRGHVRHHLPHQPVGDLGPRQSSAQFARHVLDRISIGDHGGDRDDRGLGPLGLVRVVPLRHGRFRLLALVDSGVFQMLFGDDELPEPLAATAPDMLVLDLQLSNTSHHSFPLALGPIPKDRVVIALLLLPFPLLFVAIR